MKQQRFQTWVSLSLSILISSGNMLLAWATTDWYMLKSNGKTIGKVQVKSYPASENAGGTITEISNTGHYTREGSPFEMTAVSRFVERKQDGKPLSFTYAYELGNQRVMEAEGELQDGMLDLRMVQEQASMAGKAPVQEGQFLFPGGQAIQKIYQQHYHDEPGSRFQFQTLNLGVKPEIVNTEVTLLGDEKLALSTGEKKRVRKFELRNPAGHEKSVYEWRDAQGKLYKAQSLGADGMEMVYASRRQVREVDKESLDLVMASAVLSNKIAQPRITNEALYRIAPINGHSIDWSTAFPETDTQEIIGGGLSGLQSSTPNELLLKVVQRPPRDSSVPYPIQAQSQYLYSSPFVESTDPEIDHAALEIVGQEKRAYYAARLIQQWVYHNIGHKDLSLGFASAKETLFSRQGDCTEHAVLFAALTRALGIPSRVAIGLIYIPNGNSNLGRFVYHMWNEIYLGDRDKGEWVPLDATNPELMADATHIKVADSALTSTSDLMALTQKVVALMGKMRIDVLKAMSPSQSTLVASQASGVLAVDIPKIDIQQVDIRNLSRKAIKHYRVEMPPASLSQETADGLFTYGVELLSKGQYEEAQAAFNRSLAKVRRPVEAYRMGERLAGLEMYALASQAFQMARQKDSRFGPLVDSWMNAYLPQQQLPDAVNREFMLGLFGKGDPAALMQSVIRQSSGFAPAYRHWGEMTSSGAEAVEALKKAVALAPNDFRNHESLGDVLMDQSKYSAATQAYRNACLILMETRFAQTKSWLEDVHGKWELAYGSALLAKNKRNAAGWVAVGKGLLRQNRQQDALTAFNNAIILSPGNADARVYRFEMALKGSDWKRIYATKDSIASLAGHNVKAAALLGQYQMRSRQYSPAVQNLQRAIAMSPKTPDAYLTLAQTYLRMAEQQDAKKKTVKSASMSAKLRNQAISTLQKGMTALDKVNEQQELGMYLAKLFFEQGKPKEAHALADRILTENPISGKGYVLKGKAQFYAGNYPEARDTLESALILNPNDPDALVLLGHVAKEEGRDAIAMDYYQRAYKADALNEEASSSYKALMAQLQIVGQKPPDFWYLSDDEHDFLVQLLYQGKLIKLNTRDYFKKLAELPGYSGKVDFTVKGIEAIEGFKPFLTQLYGNELAGYERLQAMQVPGRFAQMHYNFSMVSLNHMKLFDRILQDFPTLNPTTPKQDKEFKAMISVFSIMDGLLAKELLAISNKLPEPVFRSLVSEAQLDDLPQLNQDISRLTTTLTTQKAPPKQQPGLPGAVQSPVGGLPGAVPGMPNLPGSAAIPPTSAAGPPSQLVPNIPVKF